MAVGCVGRCRSLVNVHRQSVFTLVSVACAITIGLSLRLRTDPWSEREIMYVKFPGTLFLRMLKGMILPLIVPALIQASGSLDLSLSAKIGVKVITYYMSTTVLAVFEGIVLVSLIQPGTRSNDVFKKSGIILEKNVTNVDMLMDLVRNLFPPNIFQATLEKSQTVLIYPGKTAQNDLVLEDDKSTWTFEEKWTSGTNILGLIIVSLAVGTAIANIGTQARTLLDLFSALTKVTMKVVEWIIFLAPIGVFFLIIGQILEMQNLGESFQLLGWYLLTVVVGISFHGLIVLPLIYVFFTRSNPFTYIGNMTNVFIASFGIASSSGLLPLTIEALETRNGIDPRITKFVLPIGATINMDGTALYEAVAALFIAQLRCHDNLSIESLLAVSITATFASIGAASIPQGGLVTIVMVLDVLGLPTADVGFLLGVDWMLDPILTSLNVLGDAIGTGIINELSKEDLMAMDNQECSIKDLSNEKMLTEEQEEEGLTLL